LIAFVPDESTKEKISQIIAEEEAHVKKFRELLDPESEEGEKISFESKR
jgi:rubrerythrin